MPNKHLDELNKMPILSNTEWSERKKWAMGLFAAVLAGLITAAILQIPSCIAPCKTVIDINDTIQIRTLLGYRGENNKLLTREERFQGGIAVILTPIIDNTSCDESIVINEISLRLSHGTTIDNFEAAYITNIHSEQSSELWHAIQTKFIEFSVKAGESWGEHLLFIPSTSRTYMEFIAEAENKSDIMLELDVMLNKMEPLSATCLISGTELWKEVAATLNSTLHFPSYVQIKCIRPKE